MDTPLSNDALASFPDFVRAVRARLDRGKTDYGDASFVRPLSAVLSEQAEEALDLAGWGFIFWARIVRLQRAIEASEQALSAGVRPNGGLAVSGRAAADV